MEHRFLTKTLQVLALALPLALAAASVSAQSVKLTGAGATFPYPVYAKWAEAYKAKTGHSLNYQSIGSSGGVKQIKAKTVDFGATDAPLPAAELQAEGLLQFPAVIGGVVPVVNVAGLQAGQLKLTGEVLADVFAGRITHWNDKRITELNPTLPLPAEAITIVHRADGSGTTAVFTDYLSKVSREWKERIGAGPTVKWSAASAMGGKGNEGVAANVQRIKNAIGYVEYAYAKRNKMTHVQLRNASGQYVQPDDETFAAAAAGTDWSKVAGMGIYLTQAPGAKSWPITGASFILMHRNPDNKATAQEVLKFFDFAFKEGRQMAQELDYVPMPSATVQYIRQNVWTQLARP